MQIRGTLLGCLLLASLAGGCGPGKEEIIRQLTKQNNALTVKHIELERRLGLRDRENAALQLQLENLSMRGAVDLPVLFPLDRIKLLSITSGTDTDGVLGDDAVAVYFRPLDRDGHVLKRGGEITIKLLDNSTQGQPMLLGLTVVNDHDELSHAWYGRFWTNHYKVVVPFAPDVVLRPNQEVDVHVSFMDFGTGRILTDRTVVNVNIVNPDENLEP